MPTTILCLSSYFKGGAFLEECKRQGCHTILVTSQDLEHEAWPREAIDEFFVMPFNTLFKQPDITNAVAFLARTRKIDRIIPLDDFDVETFKSDPQEYIEHDVEGTDQWTRRRAATELIRALLEAFYDRADFVGRVREYLAARMPSASFTTS